jgi:hypothetical protein
MKVNNDRATEQLPDRSEGSIVVGSSGEPELAPTSEELKARINKRDSG